MTTTFTKEMQTQTSPDRAIELLVEGNERFLNGNMLTRDLLQQAEETANGQNPFAVVLSCIDSRTSSELIFDQGIGDIFNVRIAGNIINEDILGSMEFGCKAAGSKVILVLGHSSCGAVKGACDNVEMGNLTTLLNKIQPAIKEETQTKENRTAANAEFVKNVTDINVKRAIAEIHEKSAVLKEMSDKGEIKIVGGVHNVATGKVNFIDL